MAVGRKAGPALALGVSFGSLTWAFVAALRGGSAATSLAGPRRSKRGYAVRCYMIQMTNPKAALSWVAIISLGLPSAAPLWVTLMIGAGTYALPMMAHLAYAQVFSTLVMGRARRCIQATLGAFCLCRSETAIISTLNGA
jgi:amino acid exporter